MRFGVLGPYLIHSDRENRIRAAKHRSLFAVLTVNANTFVTVRRLTGELRPDTPPNSAENLVNAAAQIGTAIGIAVLLAVPGGQVTAYLAAAGLAVLATAVCARTR
ncbi:hypothetical protein [Actinoplanes sp. G11-F43]|uniref:hypothetical protein n=1 Tax=Actinoplanes sp. G11-F43 TaxID=3424130 RepID=UPI003D357182